MHDLLPSQELRDFLDHLTTAPGVYQMRDASGTVLYVGKALNLKRRVSSYFQKQTQPIKTQRLVEQIVSIEVCVTHSETEALLLESSLIKSLRPKYNVLMRDDKSYPFIHVTQHAFPSMKLVRAKKKPQSGQFFGPFPSRYAAQETLSVLQKVFQIRNCTDAFFQARTRPCLQYQIKRCSAPCSAYISATAYRQTLQDAVGFLQGKNVNMLKQLEQQMAQAVQQLAFEQAGQLRDRIKSLRLVQEFQAIVAMKGDVDVIVAAVQPGFACLQCVTIRRGEVIASQHFFPAMPKEALDHAGNLWQAVFFAFVTFYYLEHVERIPPLILLDQALPEQQAIEQLLSQLLQKKCRIQISGRGIKAKWLEFAKLNLGSVMAKHQMTQSVLAQRYLALQNALKLSRPITRMCCFDVSHTQGTATVAACVVFDEQGPLKSDYRLWNIDNITPGDDYAAMEQALTRCFKRLLLTKNFPDLLIIDGGRGQVGVAQRVLQALQVPAMAIIGIAKGPERIAGLERLIWQGQELSWPADSLALHLLQHIRDEAHRFAISSHRKKRQANSLHSSLEDIPGIGAKKRQALLARFGGLRELRQATAEEIAKVDGINQKLAARILQYLKS